MKRNTWKNVLILVVFTFFLISCGSGSPGSPGTSGGSEAGSTLLVESVTPSNTYLRANDLTSTETVDVTIGNYDLPNQTGTATAITFTKYTVEYKPLTRGCPYLDNEYHQGTWFVDANSTATFTLPFWDDHTKLQYRYPNDPRIFHYNVVFTMTGYNIFSKKVTVVFQFNITTKK